MHGNEHDCAECREARAIRLREVDSKLNRAGFNANKLLRKRGFGKLNRSRFKEIPLKSKPVPTNRIPVPGNPRISAPNTKPLWNVERTKANEPVRYTIAKNGAVIGGYEARYEDKSIREIATESFEKK